MKKPRYPSGYIIKEGQDRPVGQSTREKLVGRVILVIMIVAIVGLCALPNLLRM